MFQPPPQNPNYRPRLIVVGLIVAAIVFPLALIVLDEAVNGSISRSFQSSSGAPFVSRDVFNELPADKKILEASKVCRAVELPEQFELLQTSTNFVTPTRASVIFQFRTRRPVDEIMAFFRGTLSRGRRHNPATGSFDGSDSTVGVVKTGEDENGSIYEITCDRWEEPPIRFGV